MTAKHTPGPWTFAGPSPGGTTCDDGGDYAIVQNGGIIAEAIHRVDVARYEDARANAALIAAAPDLLDACVRAEWWLSTIGDSDAIREIVRLAITKAKGETP